MTETEQQPMDSEQTSQVLPEGGIDVTEKKDGGVVKVILKEGSGDLHPQQGDTVYVHYVGTLADTGEKFDSSKDRNEEFSFSLGKGHVIEAWDLGVASMKKGEQARFHCRASCAYGETGSPPKIPPNADLIFEVELIRWTGEDISPNKDGSISKSILEHGEKYATPTDFTPLTVDILGYHADRKFLEKIDLNFALGECNEAGLPEGIDTALKKINEKEKAIVRIRGQSPWSYGSAPPSDLGLPPNADLEFIVTLKSYEKVKANWEMDSQEKLTAADEAKSRGTVFFQAKKYLLALKQYKRVIDLLQFENTYDGENKTKRDSLMTAAYLNLALAHLKIGDILECIENCDKVLQTSPDNIKALYRRALAHQDKSDFEEAIVDYEKVLSIEKDNKAALQGVQWCRAKLDEYKKIEKKKYAKMFEKFSARDTVKERFESEKARKNAFPNASDEAEDANSSMDGDDESKPQTSAVQMNGDSAAAMAN